VKSTLIDILGIVATADSIPTLSEALVDATTLEAACRALSRVPSAAAATAVRAVIEGGADLDATSRVALLNALGAQRDLASVQTLADTAESAEDEEVQMAALGALALNPLAYAYVHVFWGVLPDADDHAARRKRRRVWSCLLKVGEAFIEAGEIGMASDLYCELLDVAATLEERCGALAGCGRAGRRAAPDAVYEALDDDNPVIRATALEALGEMRGIVVPVIAARLETAPPSKKVELLEALGRRAEPEAAKAAAAYVKDPDESVRRAALAALESKSSEEAARALVTAILEGYPIATEGAA
jgi:HEAT repeat protein